jgi:hypothetical protein
MPAVGFEVVRRQSTLSCKGSVKRSVGNEEIDQAMLDDFNVICVMLSSRGFNNELVEN